MTPHFPTIHTYTPKSNLVLPCSRHQLDGVSALKELLDLELSYFMVSRNWEAYQTELDAEYYQDIAEVRMIEIHRAFFNLCESISNLDETSSVSHHKNWNFRRPIPCGNQNCAVFRAVRNKNHHEWFRRFLTLILKYDDNRNGFHKSLYICGTNYEEVYMPQFRAAFEEYLYLVSNKERDRILKEDAMRYASGGLVDDPSIRLEIAKSQETVDLTLVTLKHIGCILEYLDSCRSNYQQYQEVTEELSLLLTEKIRGLVTSAGPSVTYKTTLIQEDSEDRCVVLGDTIVIGDNIINWFCQSAHATMLLYRGLQSNRLQQDLTSSL